MNKNIISFIWLFCFFSTNAQNQEKKDISYFEQFKAQSKIEKIQNIKDYIEFINQDGKFEGFLEDGYIMKHKKVIGGFSTDTRYQQLEGRIKIIMSDYGGGTKKYRSRIIKVYLNNTLCYYCKSICNKRKRNFFLECYIDENGKVIACDRKAKAKLINVSKYIANNK